MNKNILLGLAAFALGLVAVNSFKPVLAYQGKMGQNYSVERHTVNQTAFEKNDYTAWVKNMTGRGATRFVTKENFGEFSKAQLSAAKGDNTLLNAFRAKYNWTQGNGRGQGNGGGCMNN